MRRLSEFAAFIFDLDGLVLDTEPTYFKAWQFALGTMGYQADAHFFRALSGYRFAQIQEKLRERYGNDFDIHRFKQLGGQNWHEQVQTHGIAINPGVIELLDFAEQHHIPVCIATNSPAMNAHLCLDLAGIKQRFPVIVTGDEVSDPKPAPDIFLAAAAKLAVDIRRCVIFEDSHIGIVAAAAAGAYSVFVPSTFPVNPLAQTLCNSHFDNLSQALLNLAN